MSTSTAKVHRPQGGDELRVESGGKITNAGTQAAAIADISETQGEMTAAERQKFNAVLAALRGVGILAAA